jgi:hypothetical protein
MTLEEKLRRLTLTTMAQNLETMTTQAADRNLNFPVALECLADLELEGRHCQAIERRFKLSRLPAQRTSTSSTSPITNHASKLKIASFVCSN